MTSRYRSAWLARLALMAAVAIVVGSLSGTGLADKSPRGAVGAAAPEVVEMFAAIEHGQIEVKLIPKDSTLCRVLIENKTKKPLSVKLPDAFAGVPVLAQAGMGMGGVGAGGGVGRQRGTGGMGGQQGFGGGFGGMGMMGGMGGMGMGGGMWNVPPDKIAKLQVDTVCLDHGKDDPRPGVPYVIKPIEQYTDKPAVHEVVRMLGAGQMPQRVAQAAAWHLNNNMSWEELQAKRLRFANGTWRPFFTPAEIELARGASAAAANLAEKRKSDQKTTSSLSQSSH